MDVELGDVRGPFRVRLCGFEMTIQPIGGNFANLSSIGAILFWSKLTTEVFFLHELHHQFVVGRVAVLAQCQGDPPIPIATFVLCTDLADRLPLRNVFFGARETGGMVIIAAPGEMSDLKQHFQRIDSP